MFSRQRPIAIEHVGYDTRMKLGWGTALLIALAGSIASAAQQPKQQSKANAKIDIVSVTGCLREQPADNWMLVNATDPVPSIANAPPKSELPTTAPAGKNEFKLIGVSEFDLPLHKNHTVVVKGLFIKATPTSRLNMTSIATALPTCGSSPVR